MAMVSISGNVRAAEAFRIITSLTNSLGKELINRRSVEVNMRLHFADKKTVIWQKLR